MAQPSDTGPGMSNPNVSAKDGEALIKALEHPPALEKERHGHQPYITQEFHPGTGGIEATYFESEGDAGEKDIGGGLTPDNDIAAGSQDFGDYAMPRGQGLKDPSVPNAALEDPDCGGPPLGATVGPNGLVDAFAKSKIGPDASDRSRSGY